MDITNIKTVYIIGVGGIGISGVARMLLQRGVSVYGSDRDDSLIVQDLRKLGADICIGHNPDHIPESCDLIVYTIAVPETGVERVRGKERGIPEMSYPEYIGELSKTHTTVAISGTHGKTTTTAMIGESLISAGLDPTIIVGSLLKKYQSNFIAGNSDLFVVEACEYRRSFLNLYPKILIITNIELDHVDYYTDLSDIQSAFHELALRIPSDGYIVCDPKDALVQPVLEGISAKVIDYTTYAITDQLLVPGKFNIANAQAASATCDCLGVQPEQSIQYLKEFSGTWRRQDYLGTTHTGALVYDDYAHHPTAVHLAITAFKERFLDKKITVVFQSHTYSRTKALLAEFAQALSLADRVILCPVYAAREPYDAEGDANALFVEVKKYHTDVMVVDSYDEAFEIIQNLRPGERDIILTMGAGPVNEVALLLVK
jgi:UDP-N-acetylmuramate--alanine ligase